MVTRFDASRNDGMRKRRNGSVWISRSTLASLAMLVALLFCGLAHAQIGDLQRLSITPVDAPDAGIPVFRDHPDKAAIIIESSLTNLVFESNMGGIVDQRSEPARGRYILIIEPFTQILQVNAPGFITGRFRVAAPQARDVLHYEIEPEERAPDLISVIFNVKQDDATLYVDDQLTEANQTVQLVPGVHQVRLEREGYRIIEDAVNVSPGNIQFNYEMEVIDLVPVYISSNVPEARVLIDGTERGQIDRAGGFGLFLYPGSYALTVIQSGYVTRNENLEVAEEGQNRISVDLQRNVGELALDLTPSDASVELNLQGYSGQDLVELAPGRYRLDVIKDGYAPHSESIEIVRNERLERSITLEAYTGSLKFTASPSDAKVTLLDRYGEVVANWQGINLLRNLKVGTYILQVEAPDHLPMEQTIAISRDQTLEHRIVLTEGTPWDRDTQTRVVEAREPQTVRNLDTDEQDPEANRPTNSAPVTYVVKSGDTVGHIAAWFDTQAWRIRSWNNIGNLIRPGQHLNIYVPAHLRDQYAQLNNMSRAERNSFSVSSASTRVASGSDGDYRIYTVRPNDNLTVISRSFNTSVEAIQSLNNLQSTRVYPGQTLRIPN